MPQVEMFHHYANHHTPPIPHTTFDNFFTGIATELGLQVSKGNLTVSHIVFTVKVNSDLFIRLKVLLLNVTRKRLLFLFLFYHLPYNLVLCN